MNLVNLQIINDCAGTDPGLPTEGTDPDRRHCTIYLFLSAHTMNGHTNRELPGLQWTHPQHTHTQQFGNGD